MMNHIDQQRETFVLYFGRFVLSYVHFWRKIGQDIDIITLFHLRLTSYRFQNGNINT